MGALVGLHHGDLIGPWDRSDRSSQQIPEPGQFCCLDVPGPGSERINGERINGL